MKQAIIVILSLIIGITLGIMLISFNPKGECKTETIGHVFEIGTNCHASN